MDVLTKDALLERAEPHYVTRKIGPLGGSVVFRQLPVAERLKVDKRWAVTDPQDSAGRLRFAIALALTALCNADRTPMFQPSEIEDDVTRMMAASSAAVEELVEANLEIQGGGKALEEALGNSGEIPGEPSSIGSPGISDTPASSDSPRTSLRTA